MLFPVVTSCSMILLVGSGEVARVLDDLTDLF